MEEVWNEGAADASQGYLEDTYTIHHDPGDPWHGKTLTVAEFNERLKVSRAPFPDGKFEVIGFYEDGDAIAINWLWTGTHTADLGSLPASGKVISMSGLTVYYFQADRITGHWQVVDRLGVYQQLTAG